MDSVEKEWYDKANSYQPQPGKNYGWVLDYAKFRLKFTFGNARYLEEKSLGLLKFVFSVAFGGWAVFSFLLSRGMLIDWPAMMLIVFGGLCLLNSGWHFVKAFGPTARPVPLAEDVALRSVDSSESVDGGMENFSLTLAASTEYQSKLTSQKGKSVRRGIRWAYGGTLLFILSLFWQVFRRMFPILSLAVGQWAP